MITVTPYLHFQGNCREALGYYQQIFGGSTRFMTFAESPMAGDMPLDQQQQIIHGHLQGGEVNLMGSDLTWYAQAETGGISIYLGLDDRNHLEQLFDLLSREGRVIAAVHETFWGGVFGELQDRFGIIWKLDFTPLTLPS